MTRQRLDPGERKTQILNGFLELADQHGYKSVTREQVANHLNVSAALVTRYFNDSMGLLREAAIKHAVDCLNKPVLLQALTLRDPVAVEMPEEIKKLVVNSILD